MRASRSARRTSSRTWSSLSFFTAPESISSSRCEPPCKSRPSTRWRCAHFGQVFTFASGKKFGTAHRHTTSAVRMIASAFHRVKYNIVSTRQIFRERGAQSARGFVFGGLALFLCRLALRAHPGNHLAHLSHPHAVGDFELDLVVIHHFRHLADQSARGHDGVAAPDVFDQFGVILHLL